MALLSFFKAPKTQKFDYKPRYWDPKKEELEERLSKYKPENMGNTEAVKARIARGFKKSGGSYRVNSEVRAKATRKSNITLFAIIIGLSIISYLLLGNYMPDLIKMIE